jgi:hypothetical protein
VKRRLWIAAPAVLAAAAAAVIGARASDHDDGETDQKARSLNLTDLYVFREGDQNGNPGDNDKLIFIMNTNPRSVARQQYFFSTRARYEFHVSRRGTDVDSAVTASDDVVLRFEFGPPNASKEQAITVTALRDGQTLTASGGLTTPLGAAPANNTVSLGGSTLTVFAGLREDPFFFDVEQFFKVRAAALATPDPGPVAGGFRPASTAVDFTAGYNVNSIVVRVPVAFLQGSASPAPTVFDVWETISLPN